MEKDKQIFDIIEREHQRQKKGIELIASENFVSDDVMRAMGSCLTNKYAEGYPGHRYYGGCQVVDEAETIAIERLKQIFGAEWANVQPHSGAQANMAVFMAVLKPGDKFMGLNLSHGGHLSHGSPVNFSGLVFQPVEYNVTKDTNLVDYDMLYGHRNDIDGYARALTYFDHRLPEILHKLREDDILMITADHGCDPSYRGTDHTREYVPVLYYGKKLQQNVNLHTGNTFADIGATVAELFGVAPLQVGESAASKVLMDGK